MSGYVDVETNWLSVWQENSFWMPILQFWRTQTLYIGDKCSLTKKTYMRVLNMTSCVIWRHPAVMNQTDFSYYIGDKCSLTKKTYMRV